MAKLATSRIRANICVGEMLVYLCASLQARERCEDPDSRQLHHVDRHLILGVDDRLARHRVATDRLARHDRVPDSLRLHDSRTGDVSDAAVADVVLDGGLRLRAAMSSNLEEGATDQSDVAWV